MSAFVSSPNGVEPVRDRLWLAVAAFLAGYKGQSRVHADSDLRSYLSWCQARQLDPLAAERVHLECSYGGCRKSGATSRPPCLGGSR
jgi:hypothetical protein